MESNDRLVECDFSECDFSECDLIDYNSESENVQQEIKYKIICDYFYEIENNQEEVDLTTIEDEVDSCNYIGLYKRFDKINNKKNRW